MRVVRKAIRGRYLIPYRLGLGLGSGGGCGANGYLYLDLRMRLRRGDVARRGGGCIRRLQDFMGNEEEGSKQAD